MSVKLNKKQETMLAALATDPGAVFAPVQVQKLFFLLDENLADEFGERLFAFEPYDYGPFDKAVYRELDGLEKLGYVKIEYIGSSAGRRCYSLTPQGHKIGEDKLRSFSDSARDYISEVSKWVRSLSFAALVGAIYQAYPRMRENSIFSD